MKNIAVKRYNPEEEARLFALLEEEGGDWIDYWGPEGKQKYRKALASSVVYLLFEEECLCGYVRCRDDDGFGVYVYDLLVNRQYRGNEYGRLLMEQVYHDFPEEAVYVMGDVYPYYEDALGYETEGKIYRVKMKS